LKIVGYFTGLKIQTNFLFTPKPKVVQQFKT